MVERTPALAGGGGGGGGSRVVWLEHKNTIFHNFFKNSMQLRKIYLRGGGIARNDFFQVITVLVPIVIHGLS